MDFPVPTAENVELAGLTTLEMGGPARYLVRCANPVELGEVLRRAREHELAIFILGRGSNVVVADRGFDGVVIQLCDETLTFETDGDAVLVRAAAGVDWDRLVERTVDEGLGGLECLSGIPGRVGAAPIQNVGAYGQEVAETLVAVRVVDLTTGELRTLAAADCGFGYRHSHFKDRWRDRYAVVGVDFRLPRRREGTVTYPDLRRRFGLPSAGGPAPDLASVRAAVLDVRREKSLVLDPVDPNRRSVGSFFLNPVLTVEETDEVWDRLHPARPRPVDYSTDKMPGVLTPDGRVKLAAAWLIERAGFRRGFRIGRAAISTRHSLVLTNTGGATATELLALASRIRRGVRECCGVTLHPEPVFLGFTSPIERLLG